MAFVPQWKRFETWVASAIGGRRYWANSGEAIDCEGPRFVAQCKLVRTMSLEKLVDLAITAQQQGRYRRKLGVVVIKQSGQRGSIRRPAIFVMTEEAWKDLNGQQQLRIADDLRKIREKDSAKADEG